ncbi:MAG: HEAT repeat domain-containing protein, partial [Bacteroidales bacterium]
MGLFGGSKEKREQKALEHFLGAPSVDAGQVEALKRESQDAGALLHGVLTQSHDSDHRFRALIGLNMIGITEAMVPAIIAALNDPDDLVEESAAKIVSTHRQFATSFIPALLEAYHKHPQTQYVVLQALGDYGPEARAAVEAILPDLMQPTHALPVARCLSHIGAALDPLQQAFVDVLAERR